MVRRARVERSQDARRLETELVVRWQTGDRLAGERLLRDHWATLDAFLARTIGHALDDARQDVLLAVSRSIGEFQGRSSFKTFLLSVARHVILTRIRRRYRESRHLDALPIAFAELPANEIDYTYAIDGRRVHALLPELSSSARQVLELRYFEGASHREIAEALDCTNGAARLRELRARRQLAKLLSTRSPG